MGKKLIILIVFLIIIIPIGILGADIALSISSFDPSKIAVSADMPSVSLTDDNSSINYAVNITLSTPQLGFLPKAIIINLKVYEGTNVIGDPLTTTITLGGNHTEAITGVITLAEIYEQMISGGQSLTLKVKGLVKFAIFGFTIPGIEFPIPDQSFTVP